MGQGGGSRRSSYATPENYVLIDRLTAFAQQCGHTLADLAIAWALAEPAVIAVLAGASSKEQVVANARAASWRLSEDQVAEIRTILKGEEQA